MTKERQQQYHEYFMRVAEETANLSFAKRTKVGAILVKDNRAIAQGHNGQPVNFDNVCEDVLPDGSLETKDTVIHAEANAIYFCAKNGIPTNGTTLYISMSPCVKCALAIIQAGISKVFYRTEYRDRSGIEFLRKNNIPCEQLTRERHRMSKNLLLTLGHNSSAVLVDGDKVVCGYEEERLSKVKSDSAFPRLAIMECLNNEFCDSLDTVYISYWNDSFDIFSPESEDSSYQDKHYDRKFLSTLCKQYGCKIKYLSKDFTHHDAHAYAALNFFENHASEEEKMQDFHVIVSDGFGNQEEVTTIYKKVGDQLQVVDKVYDYFSSVGLMYQYATAYCGMKMNEDEYKFLGYESHIKEHLNDEQITKLYNYSNTFIDTFIKRTQILTNTYVDDYVPNDAYINVGKLNVVRQWWNDAFDSYLDSVFGLEKEDIPVETLRCYIAAFIQNNIEQFIGHFVIKHNIKNVILSGGIFYNVKLNNFVMNKIPGKICVYPLAGDQGCGFGMYRKYHGQFDFKTLLIGKRSCFPDESVVKYRDDNKVPRFGIIPSKEELVNEVVKLLKEDKIVNLLTGSLEFGPRALCSTTTLAQPTDHNFKYINKLNGRNAVMPFAPVILERKAEKYFGKEQISKIIGSNYYMIITMDHLQTGERNEHYTGILHKYPLKDVYSSRCQFVPESSTQYIKDVLEKLQDVNDFFIQTSHNEHGRPILFSVYDALKNHIGTLKNDDEQRSYTLIGAFE